MWKSEKLLLWLHNTTPEHRQKGRAWSNTWYLLLNVDTQAKKYPTSGKTETIWERREMENKREKICTHKSFEIDTRKMVCDTEIEAIDIQSKINVPATMTAEQQQNWKYYIENFPDLCERLGAERKKVSEINKTFNVILVSPKWDFKWQIGHTPRSFSARGHGTREK